ncbi:MAG: HlyC/CorC family transporter [Gemmatimonadales bacterium]|nr:MAG: HlyC/CorC family transporter [Gemmatimonadales bacterium]
MNGLLFGLVGLTLLASALLSAAESATFSVGPSRLRTLREEGFKGSETLQTVRDEGPSIRAAAFLVNSLLNGISVGLLVAAATLEWGAPGAMAALPLGLLGILVLAEGLPRLVASRRSIRLALLSAPSLRTLEALVRPLLTPFLGLESLFQRRNGDAPASIEEREVRELAELGRREGVVEEEEHELVERAFRMDELAAWDVMTPRVDIFAWKDSLTLEEVIPQLRNVPFSRVPVYGQSVDDITGILYVREAYAAYVAGKRDLLLSELSRDPLFVPGSLPLPRLLRDFQARRIHMGIVADEFGGTDGLVTLEDVIEELVGEIEDETDILEESFVRISRSELEVEGGIELREVNYVFNVSLPHLDHRSLNGFILEELGRVPDAGETLEIPGLQIEILDATETQVVRALLRKTHAAAAEEIEGAGGTA